MNANLFLFAIIAVAGVYVFTRLRNDAGTVADALHITPATFEDATDAAAAGAIAGALSPRPVETTWDRVLSQAVYGGVR